MASPQFPLLDRKSLTFRLIVGASLLCGATLLVAYVLLTTLFDLHLRRGVDAELVDRLDDLAAGVERTGDGGIAMVRHPDVPKYERPLSGQYWQVEAEGQPPIRSRSLWDGRLPAATSRSQLGQISLREIKGPRSERLRLAQRTLQYPAPAAYVTFSVAADLAPALAAARQFSRILGVSLAVLGIGLVSAVVLQVRVGLRPLGGIKAALAAIRAGKIQRLSDDAPTEIAPLAQELNALLDHHGSLIDRARGQAGDLAHALKTPLAVLRNELENTKTPDCKVALEQIQIMSDAVQHHLARAQAIGGARLLGVRADAAHAIEALARTLPRMSDRDIDVEVQLASKPLWFAGEAQDLSELLGNLLDNACKWASAKVRIVAARSNDRLKVEIGDDGPGIAVEQRAVALQRGGRLDERKPGSGLGLTIATDLAQLYGGSLTLGQSPLGGLKVELDLPAAD
ncbi:ATP-binding protein [Dongia deserti]|uniref:ATP-binding protein n=1 Tax=Dongia deserti TaxID=2268030 RepID=UPI0013C45EB0|nr:ATP-binding protein [Dongia deserti]